MNEQIVNMSGLKPLGRAVLIRTYEVEKVTKGGIVLPSQVSDRDEMAETRATVIEVGSCCWDDEPTPRCKPGDRVLFAKYAGKVCKGTLDDVTYRVVNDRDIYLAITGEKSDE